MFLETGLGWGAGVMHALTMGFQQVISIEIETEHAKAMAQQFLKEPKPRIVAGRSVDLLPQFLEAIPDPICFWLDAHYPGGDIGIRAHNDPAISSYDRLPLELELLLILKHRKGRDVVLIDDLILYREQGRQARSELRSTLPFSSDYFYRTILSDSHECWTSNADTGYCALLPRAITMEDKELVRRIAVLALRQEL